MAGNNDSTSNRGFANMSDKEHEKASKKGGEASAKSRKSAAGSTGAASRGGENSHKNR